MTAWPLVYVEWRDSCAAQGWQSPEDLKEFAPSSCRSVGFLLRETDDHLLLAPHVTEPDGADNRKVDGVMCIPLEAVTARRSLA